MVVPNVKQQECIDINNIKGQYLVLAGPGTGKTFTIVRRIENMIKNGISPEKILCLTFTDAAAGEMKKRIDAKLGLADSNISVYTYHSFCNEIISEYSDEFELPENYRLITSAVTRSFIKDCIDEINPVAYRTEKNDPYYYIKTIDIGISEIKRNRLNKEEYFFNLEHNPEWVPQLNTWIQNNKEKEKAGKKPTKLSDIAKLEKKIAQAKELWIFYESYTKKMEKYHYIDFNDMISMVLDKFETDSSFLSKVANKYEYLLVDEYQDTNRAQNSIVFELVKGLDSKNVFVVGDDDQIIYTFQGARLNTIESFLKEFPDTKVVCLEENMRSTQSILDVARAVALQDDNRLERREEFERYEITKTLTAKNAEVIAKDKPVRFINYVDARQEYLHIVNEIEELIESDECPMKDGEKDLSQIAILTKSNAELETLAEMFKERNIACELKDGKNIFNIKSVTVLLYYLQLLTNPEKHSDKIFRLLLNSPFNINPKDYEMLCDIRSRHKSMIDSLREVKSEDCVDYSLIEKFIKIYDELRVYIESESLKNVVLEIGAKTGIFNYYLNTDVNTCENIAGFKRLVDEAKEISEIKKTVSLEDFVNYLETCIIEDIDITTDKAPVKMNAVQLSTYHSSKGKEYEYVYMPTLFNTKWEYRAGDKSAIPLAPNESKTEDQYKQDKLSTCIKLMYVGMTRAKHTLRLSCYIPSGTKMKLTQFVAQIQDKLKVENTPEYNEISYWQDMSKFLIKREYDYKKDFCSLVDAVVANKEFSPTSLDTYLKCPRQYLYKNILGIESKSKISDAASFGSVIHKVCQDAVNYAIKNKVYPEKSDMLKVYREIMKTAVFSSYEQRKNYLVHGERVIEEYHYNMSLYPIENLYETEFKVSCEINGYKFKGFIDRLDLNKDGSFSIYDYKTGKAKTSKEIGIDKEYEHYYNQIGLYKYMIEHSTGRKVEKTEFIFPEHPTKPFELELSEADCEAIKDRFIAAIEGIKSYQFSPCENRDESKIPCKYCGFSDFCSMEIV